MTTPAAPHPNTRDDDPTRILAAYPHVTRCPQCQSYVADWLPRQRADDVVAATLSRHESGHCHDPLSLASRQFAMIPVQRAPRSDC